MIYSRKRKGFTLTETLITLTILGVVAAITVPSLINKQIESANRTKVKKAMAVYEKALNQMIIDNDLKTNDAIKIEFNVAGCAKSSAYFKIVEGSGCRFKTSDRVWWDITDIENPIIMLKDDYKDTDLNTANTGLKALAQANTDTNKDVFGMIGYIDDTTGVLRINDLGVAKDGETIPTAKNKTYLDKLYGFMNKNESEISQQNAFTENCIKINENNCTYEETTFTKISFSESSIILEDGQTSSVSLTDDAYVGVISEAMSWDNAKKACPSGTRLAKAAELKQMHDNQKLKDMCNTCSNENVRFWAYEDDPRTDEHAYNMYNNDGFIGSYDMDSYKDSNYIVVCVSIP